MPDRSDRRHWRGLDAILEHHAAAGRCRGGACCDALGIVSLCERARRTQRLSKTIVTEAGVVELPGGLAISIAAGGKSGRFAVAVGGERVLTFDASRVICCEVNAKTGDWPAQLNKVREDMRAEFYQGIGASAGNAL